MCQLPSELTDLLAELAGLILLSWLTGLTLSIYTCNNVQLQSFIPTNAQKIKSANYFTYKWSSYSGYVTNASGQTKANIKQLLSIQ